MINLAGNKDCDQTIIRELVEAGIDLVFHTRRSTNEVPASVSGELDEGRFVFKRGWRYWIVEGRVPIKVARKMYADELRKDVRVAGHGGSPPPDEWAEPSDKEIRWRCQEEGLNYEFFKDIQNVTSYHIDSQEGLNFFVRHVTGKA